MRINFDAEILSQIDRYLRQQKKRVRHLVAICPTLVKERGQIQDMIRYWWEEARCDERDDSPLVMILDGDTDIGTEKVVNALMEKMIALQKYFATVMFVHNIRDGELTVRLGSSSEDISVTQKSNPWTGPWKCTRCNHEMTTRHLFNTSYYGCLC